MAERQILSWQPTPPSPQRLRLLTAVLTAFPYALQRAVLDFVLRRPTTSRLRTRTLATGTYLGWHLLNTGRHETLLKLYDPAVEIAWAGEGKPLDMPERFRGHSEILDSFGFIRQLASSGVEATIRPTEFLDAGEGCLAVRLAMVGEWNRSESPILQSASTVYTFAGGRIIRQTLRFDDRVDLEAELNAALDRA